MGRWRPAGCSVCTGPLSYISIRGSDRIIQRSCEGFERAYSLIHAELRKKRTGRMRALSGCRWHLDEVFVKINGERHYLWRAVDQEGEVLEAFVSKKRDRKAALKFLRELMKRYPRPDAIITDRLRSYRAALRELGGSGRHQAGRWLNNRAENSHLPFRRREHAMLRFRRMRSLQKFATVHSVRLQPLQPATMPAAHGTIPRSTAPLHLPSGVNSWRPKSPVLE